MNSENIIHIGIDWADAKHDFHLIKADGETSIGVFEQKPEAIEVQIEAWRKACPDARFAVAIETTKGALINALVQYDDIEVYPVQPQLTGQLS